MSILTSCVFAPLSVSVCKFKAHKRCAVRATNNCKWTTLASIGKDIIEDEDGVRHTSMWPKWLHLRRLTCRLCLRLHQVSMPHQWLEGNLPVSAKCHVCDKTCGSVLRLQDWRCLWCKAMVSSSPSLCFGTAVTCITVASLALLLVLPLSLQLQLLESPEKYPMLMPVSFKS